jgi:hypothetical protein
VEEEVAPARTGAQAFDRSQSDREVMAVLGACFDAFNRQTRGRRSAPTTFHTFDCGRAGGEPSLKTAGRETLAVK